MVKIDENDPNFIPMYREGRTLADVNHNMTQLILIFNHNSTQSTKSLKIIAKAATSNKEAQIAQANDIKWIKRIGFGICGFISLILLGIISTAFA